MHSTTEFGGPPVVKQALERRVREYLGNRPTQDHPLMYLKAALCIGGVAAAYYWLVFASQTTLEGVLAGLTLATAMIGVGFNVQHDANHGGFSKRPWVNRSLGFTLDLLGASSYFWADKHNHNHHVYTNCSVEDADIQLGGLARMSADHEWKWFHKYQHVYLWVLYCGIHLRYLYSDLQRLAFGKNDGLSAPYPKGSHMAALIFGKIFFITFAFVIPLQYYSFGRVFGTYVLVSMLIGLVFGLVFQSAHSVDNVEHPVLADGPKRAEWVVHQIRTTANFATGNKVLTFFLGGLNYQREHHLFPKISHVHYPAISRIVREVCDEQGVKYCEHPTFTGAILSHYRWVRSLRLNPAPAEAEASASI